AREDVLHRAQPVLEGGDDAEIAAAATQRPEEVLVLLLAGHDEAPGGQHDVGGLQVVEGKALAARQVADAASEGQARDTRGRDDAARRGKSESVVGVVEVAPGASAFRADRLR